MCERIAGDWLVLEGTFADGFDVEATRDGEVVGDGMLYSAGEITIGTSYFLKNKKYYPMIIAEKNIIVLPPTTDSIFVGYEKYREELWHNFIQSEKANVLTTKNISKPQRNS